MKRPAPKDRAAVARLAALLDSSDDAIIETGRDGRIKTWNPAARRLYGYAESETLGRPLSFLAPSGRRAELAQIMSRVKGGRAVSHLETEHRRKDGRLVSVSLSISAVRGEGGKVVGAALSARDITERRRADERFRLAVEAAPNAMLMVDGAGKIVLVNTQTERLFGYAREELLGRTVETLIPERYRRAHVAHRAGFFAAPSARAMGAGRDLFGLRKDGTEVPIEIGLNPFTSAEEPFVLASIIDITERRALERRLANSEVLAAVGGMVTVVAHEIRNPLGSILMGAKAMVRGDLSPSDQEQVIGVLIREGERLNRTLSDFLQCARPRDPNKRLGDLNAALREILDAVKSDAESAGKVVIQEAFDSGIPAVAFDADQIRQVFWNLIRNGLQALGGKGRLAVATETRGGQVVVHIQDSGPGIPPEQLKRLFMPFFTTKAKGTGLGLSISRNIVLAHGGDIEVKTAPGKGTRFSVLLPLSRP